MIAPDLPVRERLRHHHIDRMRHGLLLLLLARMAWIGAGRLRSDQICR